VGATEEVKKFELRNYSSSYALWKVWKTKNELKKRRVRRKKPGENPM